MTAPPDSSSCPPSTSPGAEAVQLVQGVAGTGGRVRRPAGRPPRPGRTRAPSGCTSSTSTPPSGAGPTASCSPRSSAGSTSRSRCPAASATPRRSTAALATGCRRVNLGTAALEDPEWTAAAIAEHGDRVAVGLDVRGTTLAARGWTQEGGDLWETLEPARRARAAPATSSPTSTRTACSRARTSTCCARSARAPTGRSWPPAGSRRSTTSRRSAPWSATGVEGAIVGSALYRGAFTLPEALDVAGRP